MVLDGLVAGSEEGLFLEEVRVDFVSKLWGKGQEREFPWRKISI